MNYELANKLKEAGFPSITRWEVENNYRRHITVSGAEALPPLGAILSELDYPVAIEKNRKGEFSAYRMDDSAYDYYQSNQEKDDENRKQLGLPERVQEQNYTTYRDDHIYNCFNASTPEEAVANLWLALNSK
jgi:hypothetical protein